MVKKINWRRVLGILVLISLIGSMIFTVIRLMGVPNENPLVRSDYALIILECCLGIVVLFLPNWIEKKWYVTLPNYIHILYFIFLYCGIYLGEVRSFYYNIPYWDSILHGFSGIMLGLFGFILVDILNKSEKIKVNLSPIFVAFFAFCFALAMGALWEIYEFSGDGLLRLNMQKYRLADGTLLIGHEAIRDTMKDIMIDAGGAFIAALLGLLSLKKKRKHKIKEHHL